MRANSGDSDEQDHTSDSASGHVQGHDWDRRHRPITLGGEPVYSIEDLPAGAAPTWPTPEYSVDWDSLIRLLKDLGLTFEETRLAFANRVIGVPRDELPAALGWPKRFVETVRRRVTRKFKAIRQQHLDPRLPTILRRDPSGTAQQVRFAGGGITWELLPSEKNKPPDVPGSRDSGAT